ncbi:MAG TPA: hypothetical protein EYH14_02210 [Euryarchaeota archaeon]|nr:hypothetical protein [Euryarchaeota archaeon]
MLVMYGGDSQQGGKGDDAALLAALAAAAMQQEQKPKYSKYLEGLLPLILLLILGGFLAVRMGIIPAHLPGFTKAYDVLILTDDPEAREIKELQSVLQTGSGGYLQITTIPYTTELDPEFPVSADQLGNYDIVILYQIRDKILTLSQRDELSIYLRGGGKLIIVRDSGTCYPASELLSGATVTQPICTGWGGGIRYDLGEYIPVRCVSADGGACKTTTIHNVRIRFLDPRSELTPNPGNPYYPSKDGRISRVTVLQNVRPAGMGRAVAKFQVMSGDKVVDTYYAIIAAEGFLGYKVVFLNYDPYQFPHILYKIIQWMG